jgi:hypothetical protein
MMARIVRANFLIVQRRPNIGICFRSFASDAAAAPKPSPTPVVKSGPSAVSVFFQRISSFIVGAGVTALGTQLYIHQEVVDGNQQMLKKQKELEGRLAALEKKL